MTKDELLPATLAWLGISDTSTGPDVDAAELVVPAVLSFVSSIPDLPTVIDETSGKETWSEKVKLGATMLAARLVRRRNSPQGVAAFTAEGGATYVSRIDPDVAQLLRVGPYAAPQVG